MHPQDGQRPDAEHRLCAPSLQLDQLFRLFLGSPDASEDRIVSPASPALRSRLMVIFTKSLTAANRFPATMQVLLIEGSPNLAAPLQTRLTLSITGADHCRAAVKQSWVGTCKCLHMLCCADHC